MAIVDTQQLPAPVALTAGTEAVVLVNVVDAGAGGNYPQGRIIRGVIHYTAGATGGVISIRCRQGLTTAGTQVGLTQTPTVVASVATLLPFYFNDLSAAGAGAYCVTINAAGSNGTANDGNLTVEFPDPYGGE